MLVDAHSHFLANYAPSAALKTSLDQVKEFDLPAFDAAAERHGLIGLVTLAQEMTRIHGQWLGSNALMAAFEELRPQMVLGMAGAEPLDERDLLNQERLAEVKAAFEVKRLHGLLLTPPYGHYYSNDPRCYPFYALAEAMDVPVYLHHSAQLGEAHLAPMKFARPWLLDEVAADFPKLTLLVEHMGWPWTQELFALMAHCPRVWTDISMLTCRPHLLAWNLTMARDYNLLDRIVWGTDYVGDRVDEWEAVIEGDTQWLRTELNPLLAQCGWPVMAEEELDGLLWANAHRLLGLT